MRCRRGCQIGLPDCQNAPFTGSEYYQPENTLKPSASLMVRCRRIGGGEPSGKIARYTDGRSDGPKSHIRCMYKLYLIMGCKQPNMSIY